MGLEFLATFLFATSIAIANLVENSWNALGIIFNVSNFIVVCCLGVSFWKINKMTMKLVGIYRNENTMILHFLFFVGATFTSLIASVLILVAYSYLDSNNQEDTISRLLIAAYSFLTVSTVCWRFVNILVLYIFIKYGKPLEENAEALIQNILHKIMVQRQKEANDPELMLLRKQKHYQQLADR